MERKMSEIECKYSWQQFRKWMRRTHPEIEVPGDGCVQELLTLFRAHRGLKKELQAAIRTAPGNRAVAIYCAARDGWWDKPDAVKAIRTAPGNRAEAICWAACDGWWPKDDEGA